MSSKHLYFKNGMWVVLALLLVLIVAACSNTNENSTVSATPTRSQTLPAQPSVITATSSKGSPGHGPVVIPSSPSASGGRNRNQQQAVLGDRTVSIESLSQAKNSNSNFLTISLTIMVQNTSQSMITNQASYFQLATDGGDMIGLSANTSSSLFGSIPVQNSLTGIITFQVPLGATNGLRLSYHPDNTSETATFPLTLSV